MITLRNAVMSVQITEDFGAQIVGVYNNAGHNALASYDWLSPIGLRAGTSYGSDNLDWHSEYRGHWQETFPNAGVDCIIDGMPLPFHGEASTARWQVDNVTEDSCALSVGSRLPLTLRRTMTLDPSRAALRIEGLVTNVGSLPVKFVWGQHPAFPATEGARIDYPATARIRPDSERTGGLAGEPANWPVAALLSGATEDLSIVPGDAIHRLMYVDGLEEGWAALRQPAGGVSVALAWDVAAHPFSWLWVMRDEPAFPFYGRARVVAIEAQTSWPYDGLTGAIERGMAHELQPGQSMTSWYTMVLIDEATAPVTHVNRDGDVTYGAHNE